MEIQVTIPTSVVVFRLSGQLCAVKLEAVTEIVPMATLSRPPNRPALLEGFLNLAGSVIPVLRLDRMFGLAEQQLDLYTPLLIVRTQTGRLALWVERVLEIQSVAPGSTLEVAPGHTFKGCVEALLGTVEQPIQLLALDRILLEQERQCLAEFQVKEKQRLQELEVTRA